MWIFYSDYAKKTPPSFENRLMQSEASLTQLEALLMKLEDYLMHLEALLTELEARLMQSEDHLQDSEARSQAYFHLRIPYFTGRSTKNVEIKKFYVLPISSDYFLYLERDIKKYLSES